MNKQIEKRFDKEFGTFDSLIKGDILNRFKHFLSQELDRQKKEIVKRFKKRRIVLLELIEHHDLDIDRERLDELDQAIEQIKKV